MMYCVCVCECVSAHREVRQQGVELVGLEAGHEQRPRPMVHRLVDAEHLGRPRETHGRVEATPPSTRIRLVLYIA